MNNEVGEAVVEAGRNAEQPPLLLLHQRECDVRFSHGESNVAAEPANVRK
jgi:hypothetical protein